MEDALIMGTKGSIWKTPRWPQSISCVIFWTQKGRSMNGSNATSMEMDNKGIGYRSSWQSVCNNLG